MCTQCDNFVPDRRRFLSGSVASLVAAAGLLTAHRANAAQGTSVAPGQAVERLKAGNAKYVNAPQLCAADLLKQREQVAKGQTPWATVITCSDSRVPPELVFGGLGLGELFVARNAGNMVDTATMGTVEYGAEHLGVPLIVVMGHAKCGAVAAACETVKNGVRFPGSMGPMVNAIVPAAKAVYRKPGDFVDNAIRESARRTAIKVATASKIVSHLVKENKVKVLAAYYGLDDGRVEFLT